MSWLLLEEITINSKHIVAIVNQPNTVNVIIAKSVLYNGVKTKCITVPKLETTPNRMPLGDYEILLKFLKDIGQYSDYF